MAFVKIWLLVRRCSDLLTSAVANEFADPGGDFINRVSTRPSNRDRAPPIEFLTGGPANRPPETHLCSGRGSATSARIARPLCSECPLLADAVEKVRWRE